MQRKRTAPRHEGYQQTADDVEREDEKERAYLVFLDEACRARIEAQGVVDHGEQAEREEHGADDALFCKVAEAGNADAAAGKDGRFDGANHSNRGRRCFRRRKCTKIIWTTAACRAPYLTRVCNVTGRLPGFPRCSGSSGHSGHSGDSGFSGDSGHSGFSGLSGPPQKTAAARAICKGNIVLLQPVISIHSETIPTAMQQKIIILDFGWDGFAVD